MRNDSLRVLITGGTGFIGQNLITELLHRKRGDIYVLVRSGSRKKLEELKKGWGPSARRVIPVTGDLTRSMLGVPAKLNTAALRRQSYMRIAAEGRPIPWKEIWIEPAKSETQPGKLLGGSEVDLAEYDDPRELLMEWLLPPVMLIPPET